MKFSHIYGHQDERLPEQLLDRNSQLNIECDGLAKRLVVEEWRQQGKSRETLPHERMVCIVDGEKMIGDIGSCVRDVRGKQFMKKHLADTGKMAGKVFDKVDWVANGKAMEGSAQQFRLWVTKHSSGFCGTNKMLKRWGESITEFCPCCQKIGVSEDTRHQMHCDMDERKSFCRRI